MTQQKTNNPTTKEAVELNILGTVSGYIVGEMEKISQDMIANDAHHLGRYRAYRDILDYISTFTDTSVKSEK